MSENESNSVGVQEALAASTGEPSLPKYGRRNQAQNDGDTRSRPRPRREPEGTPPEREDRRKAPERSTQRTTKKPAADDDSGDEQEATGKSESGKTAKPRFDAATVARAKAYGITDSDLEGYDKADDLNKEFTRLDRIMLNRAEQRKQAEKEKGQPSGEGKPEQDGQQQGKGDGHQPQTPPERQTWQAPQPPAQPQGQQPQAQPNADDFAFDAKWLQDFEDEGTGKELQRLAGHYNAQFQRDRQHIGQFVQYLGKTLRERDEHVSAVINHLEEELAQMHAQAFGEEWHEVVNDPEKFKKGMATARALAATYREEGIPHPGMRELLRRGLALEFGDQVKNDAVETLRHNVRDEQGQFTARPSSGRPPVKKKGREAAIATAERHAARIFGRE